MEKINRRIRIENLTFDANEDCLVVRRRRGTTKEKTLVALDEIESTQVKKVSKPILLFLAIFFLVVCGVAAYPALPLASDKAHPYGMLGRCAGYGVVQYERLENYPINVSPVSLRYCSALYNAATYSNL